MTDFIIGDAANAQAPSAADLIFDMDLAGFEEKVIKQSMTIPVLVDFWAPWCGPCKQLTPMLEQAVQRAGGAVKLAKVNGDDNPELMQMLRIQSFPTVFAFWQGQPVDAFMGAVPQSQIDQFIAKLTKLSGGAGAALDEAQMKQLLEQGDQLIEAGQIDQAQALYGQILEAMPTAWAALAGLLKTYLAQGDAETVQAYFEGMEEDAAKDPAIVALKTQLELAANAPADSETAELEARIATDAADHEARFELAQSLFAAGDKEPAVDHLITIMKSDRDWNEGAARLHLIKLFEAMGPTDPLTIKGRRALSSLLFS
ncbi:MAG: thioredoxin [Alphaproteobacteria bacterium]